MRILITVLSAALFLTVVAKAQELSPKLRQGANKAKPNQAANRVSSSAAQESRALEFVDKNHPELAAMLPQLKKRHPQEYQSAIHELAGSQQRLEKLATRDKTLHGIEVNLWRIDSRVRLLAAQLAMGADRDRLTGEIRKALVERTNLELRRKQLQRDQLQAKITRLDSEISRLSQRREQRVDQSLERIVAAVDKTGGRLKRKETKPTKLPSAKTNQSTTSSKD